jgi:predicted transcriptional regulator
MYMKRTTIFVPEALERDLQLYARRTGQPTAAVVREALAAYMAQRQPATELPSFAAAFDSGRTDTAERHERILFARLSPHEHVPARRAPRTTAAKARSRKRR